jgi:hypothetical protein
MCTHIRVHACTPYAHVRPDFQQEEEHARGPGSRTGDVRERETKRRREKRGRDGM